VAASAHDDLVKSTRGRCDAESWRARPATRRSSRSSRTREAPASLSLRRGRHRRRPAHGRARLAKALEKALAELAMAGTRCALALHAIEAEGEWGPTGADRLELLISPNVGEDLRPLGRIVSGGELSRVMLAMKSLASTDVPGKTLIFDEVDAGIGGAVADVVGARLHALSAARCCASPTCRRSPRSATSTTASKRAADGRTVTRVERLDEEARETEVARMMGGQAKSSRRSRRGPGLLAAQARRKAKVALEGERRKSPFVGGFAPRQRARAPLCPMRSAPRRRDVRLPMNVHDLSDRRPARGRRLRAGGDAETADVGREHVQRPRAPRRSCSPAGDCARRRRRPATGRSSPSPAASLLGRRRSGRSKLVDAVVGTQSVKQSSLVAGPRKARALIDLHPSTSRSRSTDCRDEPVRAYVTIIEGSARSAWCRTPRGTSACGRSPRSSPRSVSRATGRRRPAAR
jgi:hypothetical protein